MKYLIGNRVIDSDHIIMAEYDEARSGIDDETGRPYSHVSRCCITLTSVHLETHTVYDGGVDGCASESDKIMLREKDADRFWVAYMSDAYTVVSP